MVRKYHPRRQGLGEVYFIKVGDYYKIGATRDLYGRLHTIQVCNPTECILIHKIKTSNMRLTEKLFKSRFGRLNMRGEWFTLSDADIVYIKAGRYSKSIIDSIGDANKPLVMPDLLPA
jgi:hypothetical protein